MTAAAGQTPDQIRIDSAEEDFAAFGPLAESRVAVQQVLDLGAGEVGIND